MAAASSEAIWTCIQKNNVTGTTALVYHADGICGPDEETYGQYLDRYWRDNCDSADPVQLEAGKNRFLAMLKRCIKMRSRVADTLLEQARMRLIQDIVNGGCCDLERWEAFNVTIVRKERDGPGGDVIKDIEMQDPDRVRIVMEDGHEIMIKFKGAGYWPNYGEGFIRLPDQDPLAAAAGGGVTVPPKHLYTKLRTTNDTNTSIVVYIKITVDTYSRLDNDLRHLRQLNIVKRLYLLVRYLNPSYIRKFKDIDTENTLVWAKDPYRGNKEWDVMVREGLREIIAARNAHDVARVIRSLWSFHKILHAFLNIRGVGIDIEQPAAAAAAPAATSTVTTIFFPYHMAAGPAAAAVAAAATAAVGTPEPANNPYKRNVVLLAYNRQYNYDHVYYWINRTHPADGWRRAYLGGEDINEEYIGNLGVEGAVYGSDVQAKIDMVDPHHNRVLDLLKKTFTSQMNIFNGRTWKFMIAAKDPDFDRSNQYTMFRQLVLEEPELPPASLTVDQRYYISNCDNIHLKLEHCIAMLRNVQDFVLALVQSPRFVINNSFAAPNNASTNNATALLQFQALVQRHPPPAGWRWNLRPEAFTPFVFNGTTYRPNDFVEIIENEVRWELTGQQATDENELRAALVAFDNGGRPPQQGNPLRKAVEKAARTVGLTVDGAINEFDGRRVAPGGARRPAISWSIYDVVTRFDQYVLPSCKAYTELYDQILDLLDVLEGTTPVPAPAPAAPAAVVPSRYGHIPRDFMFGSIETMLRYYVDKIAPARAPEPASQNLVNNYNSLKNLFVHVAKVPRKELFSADYFGSLM